MPDPVSNNARTSAWTEYAVLLLLYFAFRLPDVLLIDNFSTLIFPLNFLYFGKLLFSGWAVNPELANTVIAPANASLIYPPGIYMLGNLLGNVQNAFVFLLVIQSAVPLLTYALLRMAAPRIWAFPVALLVAWYGTSARTWYPDYIIQPLLLGVLFLLLSRDGELSVRRLLTCGLLAGVVVLFKHNIGIFFCILCGTVLLLQSLREGRNAGGGAAGYVLLAGMLLFGLVFWSRLPHWDEVVFYLLPFFAFWLLLLAAHIRGCYRIDVGGFVSKAAVFGTAAAVLPLGMFLWFGSVVGYARYRQSLFGMGLEHIALWDHGILGILKSYAGFSGAAAAYGAVILLLALSGPFLVNLVGVARVATLRKCLLPHRRAVVAAAIGIMAIFMLFPLEDHKIAVSKASLFLIAATWLGASLSLKIWKRAGVVAALMLVPVALLAARSINQAATLPRASGGAVLQRVVGMPMERDIALELDRQINVLVRATHGQPYYVLTSPAFNLVTLEGLIGNPAAQYYVRFDTQALNAAVVGSVLRQLSVTPYVVVSTEDYASGGGNDASGMRQLMDHVRENYDIVDRYQPSQGISAAARHIDAFLVLERRGARLANRSSSSDRKPPSNFIGSTVEVAS
jgi:hypothetical protein